MARKITVIPGDGIGPEIADAMMRVIDAAEAGLEWEVVAAGRESYERTGQLIPDNVHSSIRRNKIAIKGPIGTPVGTGHASVNVQLRQHYKLFANIRPIKLIDGIQSRYRGEAMDMVLFRENTEDLYSGIEHTIVPGVVETLKIITSKASRRIAKSAFEYARHRGRKKVTVVHKANIMKLSDGLFLESARNVAKAFPDIEIEDLIVDNCCMQIVLNPSRFDVMLLPNLYGDIISDLCAGLVGGLGVTPGANLGARYSIFEAVHGTAPDIAGMGLANPTALILSAAMLLRFIEQDDDAFRVRNAVANVIRRGNVITPDLGGDASTDEYARELVKEIGRLRRRRTSSKARSKSTSKSKSKKTAKKTTARKTGKKKTTKKKAAKKTGKRRSA